MQISVSPVLPEKWKIKTERRKMTIAGQKIRSVRFGFRVPRNTIPGRYVIAGEVELNGKLIGEAAIALIDIVGN
jgi:hypothetical protein